MIFHILIILYFMYIWKKKKRSSQKKKKRKVISGKSQNFIELLSTAQPPSRNEHFVSPSKNLLKNRN